MDLIDNFDIIYSESGILVIRAENITKEDFDRFVMKVSPLPLPEMSAENILSEIDKETECEIKVIFDIFTKSNKQSNTPVKPTATITSSQHVKGNAKSDDCTVLTKHGKVTMDKDNLQLLSDACSAATRLPQTQVGS